MVPCALCGQKDVYDDGDICGECTAACYREIEQGLIPPAFKDLPLDLVSKDLLSARIARIKLAEKDLAIVLACEDFLKRADPFAKIPEILGIVENEDDDLMMRIVRVKQRLNGRTSEQARAKLGEVTWRMVQETKREIQQKQRPARKEMTREELFDAIRTYGPKS